MKAELTIAALIMLASAPGCAAPRAAAETRDGAASAGIGERASFSGATVIPLRIVEDSRCPIGVQCVQAGTVRLAVRIEERGAGAEQVLRLAQPLQLAGGKWLTLAAACPHPRHPPQSPPRRYRFTFTLGLAGPAPPFDFTC